YGKPSEMRFSLVNGVLEQGQLFFDLEGEGVDKVWTSMRMCARIPNGKGELVYNRPIGDDLAQATAYAFETLRGQVRYVPEVEFGGAEIQYIAAPRMEGRV